MAKIKRERLEESALSAAMMEDWHKNIAAAAGLLALTLARRKRSPKLGAELMALLAPVVAEHIAPNIC